MASSPPPSSPPYRVNLIEFVPNQIESHTEIIPRSFIHCLIRLLVAFNNSITSMQTQNFGINSNYRNFIVGANSVGANSPWGETGIIHFDNYRSLKSTSQPPPFSMPSKLFTLLGEAKSYCFSVSCVLEGMFDYL